MAPPTTIVLRHPKENLAKCSLRGLESWDSFSFIQFPGSPVPSLDNYVVLSMDGPPLEAADAELGICLIDGTWRLAKHMARELELIAPSYRRRSLPGGFRTAYPRKQTDCTDPEVGLASVEALYCAFAITGRPTEGLLKGYYWADEFLSLNHLGGGQVSG